MTSSTDAPVTIGSRTVVNGPTPTALIAAICRWSPSTRSASARSAEVAVPSIIDSVTAGPVAGTRRMTVPVMAEVPAAPWVQARATECPATSGRMVAALTVGAAGTVEPTIAVVRGLLR